MSPTTIFSPLSLHAATADGVPGLDVGRGGVPGVWEDWGGWVGAIPGTNPAPSQGPYIQLFLRQGPTHGQMKANSEK